MNRLLIGILDGLNKLLAIVIVVSSAVSGYWGHFGTYSVVLSNPVEQAIATAIGFVVGVIVAALVSGLLAAIINISREMTAIRHILNERPFVTR